MILREPKLNDGKKRMMILRGAKMKNLRKRICDFERSETEQRQEA